MSRLILSLEDWPSELYGCGLAIGNFDAIHLGHAALVRELVSQSRALGLPKVVFTFSPPPGALLFPDRPVVQPLTSLTRRNQLLGELGADALLAYPTSHRFLQLTAREFFDDILLRSLGARLLVEGPDFRFGKGREGNTQLLAQWCRQSTINFRQLEVVQVNSGVVSSTRVRELVTLGSMQEANQMLFKPYRIEGVVTSGAQRGRTIGFPTANLAHIPVLLPALGVYAGRVVQLDGEDRPAAIHIGPNPTFGEVLPKVEVHVIGWHGSIYDRKLEVEILERVRGVQKFTSVESLKEQLGRDVQQCKSIAQVPGRTP